MDEPAPDLLGILAAYQEEHPWPATSCTSWFWPFAVDGAHFEARRAIANLTHGLRHLYPDPFIAGDLDDILRFVKAAEALRDGATQALADLVAEAIAKGATWKQVGACLKVNKQAAHNRFGKGIPSARLERLTRRGLTSQALLAGWIDQLPRSAAAEEPDWEVTPPHVAVSFAFRNIVGAGGLIYTLVRGELNDEEHGNFFLQIYRKLQQSQHILLTSKALTAFAQASREARSREPWMDENAETYFIYAVHRASFALLHLSNAATAWGDGDIKLYLREVHEARFDLDGFTDTISRGECIQTLTILEERARGEGHAVHAKDEGSGEHVLKAYWKNDIDRLAEINGISVEEVGNEMSREEFFRKFDEIELSD